MIQPFYQETIYSIEQQSDFHLEQLKKLICKSSYRDYLEKSLSIGFGQLREIEFEKVEFTKPSLVILSPTIETDDLQITKLTEKLISLLKNINEYRKRYAIVHAENYSYIIGGYIFDPINKLRKSPEKDFRYHSKTDVLQPIATLPNATVSFGLTTGSYLDFGKSSPNENCLDGKYMVVIGGHTALNKPLAKCYIMEMNNLPEKWLSLPDLPLPTSGPGVGMIDGEIHVVGGFDILSSESFTHGEYYRLIWPIDTQWKKEMSIASARARSLVLLIPNENVLFGRLIYVAGGYHVDIKRHPTVKRKIRVCFCTDNEEETHWKLITIIPDFKLIHGLSFYDDKLHLSEPFLNANNEYDNRIIRSYDFQVNQWIELSNHA